MRRIPEYGYRGYMPYGYWPMGSGYGMNGYQGYGEIGVTGVNRSFIIILVLFVLLVIVGAVTYPGGNLE
ncbi:YjcZ family sporulation protein [Radiobacillus kanasensis]|uniref:YjcZ family sporulation protein n=1 Tax=Radiobacillus kanasensis TaxID=2844358 RepID=UPI002EDB4663